MDGPIVNVGQQEHEQQESNSKEVAKGEDDIAKTAAAAISAVLADHTSSKDNEEQEEPTETEEPEPTETSLADSEGDDDEGEGGDENENEQEDVRKTNSIAMTASDDNTHLRLDTVININNSNMSAEEKKEDDHMPEDVYEESNKEPVEEAPTDADSSRVKEAAAASVEDPDINAKPSMVEHTTELCHTDEPALEDVTKDEKPEIVNCGSPESGDALDTTNLELGAATKEEFNADVPTEEVKSKTTNAQEETAVEEKTEEPTEETNAEVEDAEEITDTPDVSAKVNAPDNHPESHENADATPKAAREPEGSSEDPPSAEETAESCQQADKTKKEPTTEDSPASFNNEDQTMEAKTEKPVVATSQENDEPKAGHFQQPSDGGDVATENNANDNDDDDAKPAMTASVDSDRPSGEAQVTTRLMSLSEVTAGEKSTTKSVQFAEDTIISKKDSDGIIVSSTGATSPSKRRVMFSCGVPLCGKMEDVDESDEKMEGDYKSPKFEASADSRTPVHVQEEAKSTPEDQSETTVATETSATDIPDEKKDNENLLTTCDDEAAPTAVVANDKEEAIAKEKAKITDALTEMKPTDLEIQEHRANSFDIQQRFTCAAVFTCGILGTDQLKAVALPEEPEVIKMTLSQDLIMEARETTEREVEARQQEGDLALLEFPEPPIPNLVSPPPTEKQDEVSPQEEEQVENDATGTETETPIEEKISEEKTIVEKTIEAEPQKDQPTDQQLEVEAKVPGEQLQDNETKDDKPAKEAATGDQINDTDVAEETQSEKEATEEQPAEKRVDPDVGFASASHSASQPESKQVPVDLLNEPRKDTSAVEEETNVGSTSDSPAEPTPDTPPVASATENDSKMAPTPTIQEQPAAAAFPLLAPIKGVIVDEEAASKAQQEAYACGCTIL